MLLCTKKLLLGSASERRKQILSGLGLTFDVAAPAVEEITFQDDPEKTALQNATTKHSWCRQSFPYHHTITADTVISFQGRCLGKPDSLAQAASFFREFSGKSHDILTGIAFSSPSASTPVVIVVKSSVTFKTINDSVISDYFSRVNPLDKAGAYDIAQSSELIIAEYTGSFTNIMGLPEEHVTEWLRKEQLC